MAQPFIQPATTSIGLRFEDVDKRYGGLYALRHLSLEIGAGECIALAGRNGSGKTTLLRVAAHLIRPTAGKVTSSVPAEELKSRTGFVAHSIMAYDELTAEENLLLFGRLQGVANLERRVSDLLHEVGLEQRRDSVLRTFSRGMRQRVAIARALLNEPSILLFDEPSTGLDPEGFSWLAMALRNMRDAGRTIVMSVHGESEIASLATRAVRLEAGRVAADTRSGTNLGAILRFAEA